MPPTKKAKHTTVELKTYTAQHVAYTCPSCGMTCFDHTITDKVLRIRCRCGQELILDYPKN